MENREIVKEYDAGDITIVWKPKLCIHSGICVKSLPDVYDPKAKPWITPAGAKTEDLINQIQNCPSGALSYYHKNENNQDMEQEIKSEEVEKVQIKALPNGPLQIFCDMQVIDAFGNVTEKQTRANFCRCGASENKPFCDGKHKVIGFTD